MTLPTLLKVKKVILHFICNSCSVLPSYVSTVNCPSLQFLWKTPVILLNFLKSEVLFLVYVPYIPIILGLTCLNWNRLVQNCYKVCYSKHETWQVVIQSVWFSCNYNVIRNTKLQKKHFVSLPKAKITISLFTQCRHMLSALQQLGICIFFFLFCDTEISQLYQFSYLLFN